MKCIFQFKILKILDIHRFYFDDNLLTIYYSKINRQKIFMPVKKSGLLSISYFYRAIIINKILKQIRSN